MSPAVAKTAPRYSIIVAAYNVADEIDQCLASLTASSLTDGEIIVVDDGSTDDTPSRLAPYAGDSRVRIIHQANGGLSAARNTGLAAARGDYLLFVDGDDWVDESLTCVFDAALAAAPNADLFVFDFCEVRGNQLTRAHSRADFWAMTNSACNKLYRRDLFGDDRFDTGIWYEDLAIVPALFLRAQRPTSIDAALYYYRRDRTASITNSVDTARLLQLADAARRCLARIDADTAAGRIGDPAHRLGRDWRARFETLQIFIPGVLHRARMIDDRHARLTYIKAMLARLPARTRIRPALVQEKYGRKMALGSWLYRYGFAAAGHALLHDTGALKQHIRQRLKKTH